VNAVTASVHVLNGRKLKSGSGWSMVAGYFVGDEIGGVL
tara:strand:+ start:310 stop:426 length:117 start_codon:yes stop_codon:yes gene_type:complete